MSHFQRGEYRVKYLPVRYKYLLQDKRGNCKFGNFHKSGSVIGMKNMYYGLDSLLVQCGNYIYNVTSEPKIYWDYAY